jgi:hypothetical protein
MSALYHPEAAQRPGLVLQHQVPAKAVPAARAHDRTASPRLLYVAMAIAIVILVIWATMG